MKKLYRQYHLRCSRSFRRHPDHSTLFTNNSSIFSLKSYTTISTSGRWSVRRLWMISHCQTAFTSNIIFNPYRQFISINNVTYFFFVITQLGPRIPQPFFLYYTWDIIRQGAEKFLPRRNCEGSHHNTLHGYRSHTLLHLVSLLFVPRKHDTPFLIINGGQCLLYLEQAWAILGILIGGGRHCWILLDRQFPMDVFFLIVSQSDGHSRTFGQLLHISNFDEVGAGSYIG